ncbi:MAG: universal stress protein [Pyrinomonadaceae bacterium]
MKILLATDGSPCSEAAVEEVARRPWPAESEVRVVSCVEPPAPLVAEPYMLANDYFLEVEKVERQKAQEALGGAEAKLRRGAGNQLSISTEVLRGLPKRAIIEEAEAWGADLIVVGSHGYRAWERMLLGSVSQSVAQHAACSVEIVRCRRN